MMCNREQHEPWPFRTLERMHTNHVRVAWIGTWIVAVGALGYISGATSLVAWAALTVLSLAPPAVMARLWSAPASSMSESIQNVLR